MMRAVQLIGHGGFDKLVYRDDLPVPEPDRGEVLIRVGAAGINNTDIWTREGAYGRENSQNAVSSWRRDRPMSFPRIQGADIAGQIVAVGPGVRAARIGERVLVNPTLYGEEGEGLVDAGLLGSERDGGFAEYVTVPAANAHVIESALSDAELATFPTAYLTAEHMLNRAVVRVGERILVTGASGGVGSALIQLAKIRNAQVIALTSANKEETARDVGADVVLLRDSGFLVDLLKQALPDHPVDVIADVVGGLLLHELLACLRPAGRLVIAGAIAGPVVNVDLRTLYLKHLTLIGSTLGTREEFSDIIRYIQTGKIRPLLAGTYPLSEAERAQKTFLQRQFFGKLVLLP